MFGSVKLLVGVLQIGGYILVNHASPVTNFDRGDTFVFELPKPKSQDARSLSSRISSLSAAGRSYGETTQNQPSSANGRILSQPGTPDKDAITYPDDVIRDSYGNIVTPYTSLLDDTAFRQTSTPKPANPGHLTDVNRDNGQHLQFAIPSYSDGITELQGPYKPSLTLLPPLSSGNYNYPSLNTHKPSPTVADNSYQNEIGGSFPSSPQNINLVPTGPTAITTNGHIGGNNSPSIPTTNFQSPPESPSVVPSQPISPASYQPQTGTPSFSVPSFPSNPSSPLANNVAAPHGSSDFSAIHVVAPDSSVPSSSFSFSNTKPLKDSQFVNQVPINIHVDNEKYTGGFGGAPGILGEQKVPGYAVKPSVNKQALSTSSTQVNNDHPVFNSVHAYSPLHSQNQGTQNALTNAPQQSVLPNQNNFQGSVAPAKPSNHGSFQFGTALSPNPSPSAQIGNNGKYTGGFGGPPGIYSPYDNIKAGKSVATDNNPASDPGPKRKY